MPPTRTPIPITDSRGNVLPALGSCSSLLEGFAGCEGFAAELGSCQLRATGWSAALERSISPEGPCEGAPRFCGRIVNCTWFCSPEIGVSLASTTCTVTVCVPGDRPVKVYCVSVVRTGSRVSSRNWNVGVPAAETGDSSSYFTVTKLLLICSPLLGARTRTAGAVVPV